MRGNSSFSPVITTGGVHEVMRHGVSDALRQDTWSELVARVREPGSSRAVGFPNSLHPVRSPRRISTNRSKPAKVQVRFELDQLCRQICCQCVVDCLQELLAFVAVSSSVGSHDILVDGSGNFDFGEIRVSEETCGPEGLDVYPGSDSPCLTITDPHPHLRRAS